MTGVSTPPPHITVLGEATVTLADPKQAPRRIPRVYADPVAWLLAEAVDRALTACGADAPTEPAEVGVIGVAAHPTVATLRTVAAAAAAGSVSPMRFAAAGPGAPVGLICAAFGFRGPTMLLPMPVERGAAVARTLTADWLTGPIPTARHVVVVTHETSAETTEHRARAAVLAGPAARREYQAP